MKPRPDRRWAVFGLLLLALTAGRASAQAVYVLTPEEAVARGVAHSYSLQRAGLEVDAAAEQYHAARTMRLPVLTGQGSYLRLSSNVPGFEIPLPGAPAGVGIPPVHNRYHLQMSVQQPLFTGFRIASGVRAAGARAAAARQEHAQAEAEAAFNVQQAYWACYRAEAVQEVLAQAVQQVEQHLQDVRNLRAQGLVTDREVLAVQTRLAEVRLKQVEAENGLRVARLQLNHLLGLPLAAAVQPEATVTPAPVTEDVDGLVAAALRQRAELQVLEARVEALEAGVQAARAGWYPQVAAGATYRYAQPNPYFIPPEEAFHGTWDVGVTVAVDLWNWGRTRDQVQQAQVQRQQAETHRAEVRDLIRVEVHRRYLAVQEALATLDVLQQGRAAAEETYRVTRERFGQGLALNADVLDAEVARRDAETRYRQALADYAVARAALQRAVGQPPARR